MSQRNSKLKSFDEVVELIPNLRNGSRKIVLCHGVFDLLHIGHIRHFEQAKQMGDVLVVTVTPDRYVNKGVGRPVFNQDLRAEAIASLDCVDYVAINKWPMAIETINRLRPDFYVKGADYLDSEKDRTGGIELEATAVKTVGGQISFTNDITFSSSNLINHHLGGVETEVSDFLAGFVAKYSSADVLNYLDNAGSLKVLVVGEAIIDEYLYCETMGKSGKEPVLAARFVSSEKFAGGIVAVANNVSAFSKNVTMLSVLGGGDSQKDFIKSRMNSDIEPIFLFTDNDAPTIVKQRFVENYPFQKLFEMYLMDDGDLGASQPEALIRTLETEVPKYDVVIVADYGHGMLGPEAVDVLCNKARFLAVNTQVNAGNLGFNTVSKYPQADFVCVSETEMRLDARSRRKDIKEILADVGKRLNCDQIMVTQGKEGCLSYGKQEGFFKIPAFASNVVDRIGAGDAVFAIAALCAVQKAPMEMIGFIGNVVGAQAIATVGHRESIQRPALERHIETLLK